MLLENAARVRVERLLAGDASPHNLDLLLSDLRFIKGAHPLVREVGHFAAHRGLKIKGEVQTVAKALHNALLAYMKGGGELTTGPAFSADELAKAFAGTLMNASILPKHRLASQKRYKAPLALYAICAMHGTDVELDNGALARLAVRTDADGTISIGAFLPLAPPTDILVNIAVFVTPLATADHCEGELLADMLDPQIVCDRNTTLERSPQQRLSYLV